MQLLVSIPPLTSNALVEIDTTNVYGEDLTLQGGDLQYEQKAIVLLHAGLRGVPSTWLGPAFTFQGAAFCGQYCFRFGCPNLTHSQGFKPRAAQVKYPVTVKFDSVNYANVNTNGYALWEVIEAGSVDKARFRVPDCGQTK